MVAKRRCFECGEAGHAVLDCPKLKSRREAEWRALIKPVVMRMHKEGLRAVRIEKVGGRVKLFVD